MCFNFNFNDQLPNLSPLVPMTWSRHYAVPHLQKNANFIQKNI